jgi:predicted dehydrogenase
MIKVGVAGYGYWGPNLARNFSASRKFLVAAAADGQAERREEAQSSHPGLRTYADAEEMVDDPDIDAVAIATPVATHYRLARRALLRGKHVLVEKPLCSTVAEGDELVALAAERGVTLMVDHTFLFTGAVRTMREICARGELGKITYYDSMRINLGLFQPDVNVLWDLAPHDISVMDHLLDEEPIHVEATGYSHVNTSLPDIAYVTLHFASDRVAHFNLSWMSPVKVRRTAIGGSSKMLVWDDLDREEKIKIYSSGIEFLPEDERSTIIPQYRVGDIYSPRVSSREALATMVEHFAAVIGGGVDHMTSGERGVRVVRILERAQAALDRNLAELGRLRGTRGH